MSDSPEELADYKGRSQLALSLANSKAGWFFWTLLVCAHFTFTYVADRPLFLSLEKYAQGTVELPYQFRMLVGWLLRGIVGLPVVTRVAGHFGLFRHDPYLLAFALIVLVSLFGAVLATRASIAHLTGDEMYARWSSFLVVYLSYFSLSLGYGLNYVLPYDVSSLFFFCTGIYLLLRRRYWLFYPLFALAILNRETSIFLTLFCLICEWLHYEAKPIGQRLWRMAPHAVAQALIFVAVKIAMFKLYGGNPHESGPGGLLQLHVLYNLHELLKPQQWPLLASIFGFLLPMLLLGFSYIRERRIAIGCALMLPLWCAIMLVTGVLVEIRIFTEMNSIVALALALICYNFWRERVGLSARRKSTASGADDTVATLT